MNKVLLITLLFLSLLSPAVTPASAAEKAETTGTTTVDRPAIAEQIQQTYDRMHSLAFNFHQITSGEMTGRPQRGAGHTAFLRKAGVHKMRWEYTEPDEQIIISNGITLSMYFKKLQQMIVSPADRISADLTCSFFSGRGRLTDDFIIAGPDEEYSEAVTGMTVLKLTPKRAEQVQDIHIWVDDQDLILRLAIRDHFGTVTTMNLSDIRVDALSDMSTSELKKFFSFTPPTGTEIIKQ
ncbi:outer membrane lipoprotein carrier protein LolA [Desulforhopalus vacuolatus]|uniref:LolA family protein n=1 Tax=Desulforhopalus vacuolatus TaxID=40414 RepID=UPI001966787C|nr:outer membrane lipoprotein carrier protein LolA [Desulforhopalus vacuolatus]MBM9520146.1 outer membrane lipoprotein carrier protein LolA [Desulforhopalus vacuolatus]